MSLYRVAIIGSLFFLYTRTFWRSVCVTQFANPHGSGFWVNPLQVAERTVQSVQIDMVEIATVVGGE